MDKSDSLSALSALAHETRLDAFRALVRAGDEGMAAGEIADRLGVVQNTMSAHLATLTHAGLVRSQRSGRTIRYFCALDHMRGLMEYLLDDCCGGHPELCTPSIQNFIDSRGAKTDG